MTRTTATGESRPRLVLASLVPVKTRDDPLDHAALPQTDFGVSSALRPSTKSYKDDRIGNQHEDAVIELDEKLVDVRRQWTQQQERCFDFQIESSRRLHTPPQDPGHSTKPPPLQSRLRAIEELIRGAGVELLHASAPSSEPERLDAIQQLYSQAAAHLAETVRTLQAEQHQGLQY